MSGAYYNEHDPKAAAWLRELIRRNLIAEGDVDERSITEVSSLDLLGYTQAHFFAGIAVWSYALRRAGWPDDRPVWTGSCPCQPFSVAGQGKGTEDERHLWPHFFRLIQECQPDTIFGEQVEAAIRHGWLDHVQSDLEGIGYAFGAPGLPAAGFGAPHIRQRLWFVASLGYAAGEGLEERGGGGGDVGQERAAPERAGGAVGRVADDGGAGRKIERLDRLHDGARRGDADRRGTSFWSSCEWLPCRDGKWRPTGPGIHPLVSRVENTNGVRPQEHGVRESGVPDDAGEVGRVGQSEGERLQGSGPGEVGESVGREALGRWSGDDGASDDGGGVLDHGGLAQSSPLPLAHGSAPGMVRGGDCGLPGAPQAGKEAQVAGWPTPMAGIPAQNGSNATGNNDYSLCVVAHLASWPTPRSEDSESSGARVSRGTADTLTAVSRLALGYDPNASAEARTMRLKGYGNAVVAPVAEAFIRAYLDVIA